MTTRFPGYDVLAKRDTLSWNEPTRRAVDERLAIEPGPRFFDAAEWDTLRAVCDRIMPQPAGRPPVPVAAYIDDRMASGAGDGYRLARLLPQGEAWKAALAALDAEAGERHGERFHRIPDEAQDAILSAMQTGAFRRPEMRDQPPDVFFVKRVLHDVTGAYYAHPTAWSEIGWSGPASPRGFVRMDADTRDPWEAAEAYPGEEEKAERENRHVV